MQVYLSFFLSQKLYLEKCVTNLFEITTLLYNVINSKIYILFTLLKILSKYMGER